MELLPTIWFIAIAVLWTGYLFLEGFDLGVGMLMKLFARNNTERRVLLNTIGPVWDGNEVWLLTAGGATFAAFPLWYASLFSALYLPLLAGPRGADLPCRGLRIPRQGGLRTAGATVWDWAIAAGSLVAAFGVGAALALTTTGLPLNANGDRVGGPFAWFSGYAVLGGFAVVCFSLLHALAFLALKTDGDIRHRARRWFVRLLPVLLLPIAGWAISVQLLSGKAWTCAAVAAAVVAAAFAWHFGPERPGGQGLPVPRSVPAAGQRLDLRRGLPGGASLHPQPGLQPDDFQCLILGLHAGADDIVACVGLPLVLAYQAWTYWVFRRRVSAAHIPEAHSFLPAIAARAWPPRTRTT